MRNTSWGSNRLRDNGFVHLCLISVLVIAVGIGVGWFSATLQMPTEFVLVGIAVLLAFLFLYSQSIKGVSLQKGLLYLTLVAGFIGSAFLVVPVGSIHIFPYRVLLPLLWLIFAMGVLVQGHADLSQIKVKPYLQFLGLWLVYAVVSLAWVASRGDSIRDIIFLFMGISAIFFVVYYFGNSKDLKRLYQLWLVILGGLLLVGFWEHLTGHHLSVSSFYGETRARFMFMPTGVFHNPNDFATYLALSIPFVLALIRYGRSIFARFIGLGLLIGSAYLLLETSSRANYLAVILELVFLFTFLFKLRTKLKALILSALLILALVIALPDPPQRITGTIGEQIESITSPWSLNYGSTGVRINLVKNSMVFLVRTAGFGVGAGNAEYWMGHFGVYNTRGITNPHNWWDEILVDYGIFIFAGYILFYLGLISRLYVIHRRLDTGTEKMICEALLVSLVGFFLASISSSSIMALKPQWFLLAFALAFLNYSRIDQGVRP